MTFHAEALGASGEKMRQERVWLQPLSDCISHVLGDPVSRVVPTKVFHQKVTEFGFLGRQVWGCSGGFTSIEDNSNLNLISKNSVEL